MSFIDQNSEQLKQDASLILKTIANVRWDFYSGFGMSFNLFLNSKTQIRIYDFTKLEARGKNGEIMGYCFKNSEWEKNEVYKKRWGRLLSVYSIRD
jgi:hypothetical protein